MAINDILGSGKVLPAIRGAEQQIRVTVEGREGKGSWQKVTDFTHEVVATESQTPYMGEPFDTNDQMIHGHHLTWNNHQMDASSYAFYLDMQARQLKGLPPANVTVEVREAFRDGKSRYNVLFSVNGVLTPQSRGAGSQRDFVRGGWSFRCQRISAVK